MDLKNNIKELNGVFTKIFQNKKARWEEFRDFHKFIIDNVSVELCEKIGNIQNICKTNTSYSLQFTAKDYLWWGMQNPKSIDLNSIDGFKRKVYDRITAMVDNLNESDITMEIAEELLKKLK